MALPFCGYLETWGAGRGTLRRGRRLADDCGSARIGIARSDREGVAALRARRFAAELVPLVRPAVVRLVDERFTTVMAHEALRAGGRDSRGRRPVVDQAAAALLLQSALDAERSSGNPAGELVCSVGDGG